VIVAQNLTKRYRKKIAVDDLSFEVAVGKVTGFLGPNGAGKSTTMRLMLGLDNGSGSTTYDGKQLHDFPQPAQKVGILLEAKAFHPSRSARNHLRVLAAAGGINDKRVREVLEIVGLSDVMRNRPGKFSLGMSQRLGIAAAILGQPKYLLLDEPANGLDPEGIAWLRQFIKDYADQGNAVLVSSHLLAEMSQMADNIVVIGKGKLIADTAMDRLLNSGKHSTIFVRSPKLALLQKALVANNLNVKKSENGLKVIGATSDAIGKLAFQTHIPLYELSPQTASLEEVFLDLTSGAEEYKTKSRSSK
jgi:ABC-2 type transport system ATP-binding protein